MGRLVSFLWTWIDAIMAILMAAMIVLVFTNVVMRYGFSSGLRVSVELSRLGFVWVVMLGAVVALRRGEHLAVSEFSEAFFPRAVPILRRFSWLVILVSVSMLFWGAVGQTIANWHNISPLTGLPTGVMYLAGAVSGLLMAFVAIMRLFGPPETVKPAPESK
ncbi:TRAP transporter small permease (plasmid) [Azospirillum humicireducens]|uniref:TRAP transporter small permease protein n=1 Tax=Azospirillum humicireducens TaxID=1226968 RepID=A0A2R4VUQ2_9PROT|nr:TRAP transporter small permease [Azospirillum humicireducens]AWB08154.1 TRAP transporter small permease [Azospirillum humicireducens]